MDNTGNYIDKVPSFHIIKKGLRCPCGSRKDKVYETHVMFTSHIKTKTHQLWLTGVNTNKMNYFVENEKLNETIQNQRLIIAKMERDLTTKAATIDYLTQQLVRSNTNLISVNLLEFD